MANISQQIPDKRALCAIIKQKMPSIMFTLQEKVGHLNDEYRKLKVVAILVKALTPIFLVLGFLSLSAFLSTDFYQMHNSMLIQLSLLVVFAICVYLITILIKLLEDPNLVVSRFNRGFKEVILPETANLFGLTAYWGSQHPPIDLSRFERFSLSTYKRRSSHSINYFLEQSELITEPRNTEKVDDVLEIPFNNRLLTLAEIQVFDEIISDTDEEMEITKIFNGYLATINLEQNLVGKTFISTEGDEDGFGHRTFWTELEGEGALETVLEWNDFEDLLHVATTNPIEARVILSPEFMLELNQWWQENKVNIRISFIEQHMYVLFPSKKLEFKTQAPVLDEKKVEDYILTIAYPLMRILHLVEKVNH
jgi:hypothetical protein